MNFGDYFILSFDYVITKIKKVPEFVAPDLSVVVPTTNLPTKKFGLASSVDWDQQLILRMKKKRLKIRSGNRHTASMIRKIPYMLKSIRKI